MKKQKSEVRGRKSAKTPAHLALCTTLRFNPIELAALDGACKCAAIAGVLTRGDKTATADFRALFIRINVAARRAKAKLDAAIETAREAA